MKFVYVLAPFGARHGLEPATATLLVHAGAKDRTTIFRAKRTPQRRRCTRKLTTGRQTRVKRKCPLSVALDQAESALNLREVGRKRGDSYAFKRVAPTHREASSTLPADE